MKTNTRFGKERKKEFAKQFIACKLNATQAAIELGIPEKSAQSMASQMLALPDVQKLIQKAMDKRAKRTDITADYVLLSIKEIAEAAKTEKEWSQALKAFELMGKHLKLFTEVNEHQFNLTKMGRVELSNAKGDKIALDFNVGDEPNQLK